MNQPTEITITLTIEEAQFTGGALAQCPCNLGQDTMRRTVLQKMQDAATAASTPPAEPAKIETLKKEKAS